MRVPIINIANDKLHVEEMIRLNMEVIAAREPLGLTPTAYVRKCLGRQSYTFTGEFRWYVWEFPDCTLWASNRGGLTVDVPSDFSADEAMTAYRGVFQKLLL